MKALILCFTLLSSILLPTRTLAMPMLSSDGTLLTGVQYAGELYNVTFGDGVIGDLYPQSVLEAPGWFDLANGIKQGIVDALNALPVLPLAADISGCDGSEFAGVFGCLILIPDTLVPSGGGELYSDVNAAGLDANGARRTSITSLLPVAPGYDTSANGDLAGLTTFAQFQLASATVPTPGSLGLIVLALFMGRGFIRR